MSRWIRIALAAWTPLAARQALVEGLFAVVPRGDAGTPRPRAARAIGPAGPAARGPDRTPARVDSLAACTAGTVR